MINKTEGLKNPLHNIFMKSYLEKCLHIKICVICKTLPYQGVILFSMIGLYIGVRLKIIRMYQKKGTD